MKNELSSNLISNNEISFHLGSAVASPSNNFKETENGKYSGRYNLAPMQVAEKSKLPLASWAILCSAQSIQPHVAS